MTQPAVPAAPAPPAAPKVSVVMIAYNQEQFVREAVESALSQDYPNLEIVICDDASTDRTPAIIRELQAGHPQLMAVFHPLNLGVTRACNAALRRCTGKYVAFLAADDLFLPGKISAQVAWFEERPERALCGHQVEVFYDDGSRAPHPLTRRLRSGSGPETFIREGPYGACAVMVRAENMPAHGFDESLAVMSDQLFWAEVLADGGEFGYVPGTLSRYRRHTANVTNAPLNYFDDVERYLQLMAERHPQYAALCEYAYVRRLYDAGICHMKEGRPREARGRFLLALRREPLFLKAWLRLMQTFV